MATIFGQSRAVVETEAPEGKLAVGVSIGFYNVAWTLGIHSRHPRRGATPPARAGRYEGCNRSRAGPSARAASPMTSATARPQRDGRDFRKALVDGGPLTITS